MHHLELAACFSSHRAKELGAPRNLFDLGLGVDNLLHTERQRLRLHVSVINLTNQDALYNFLSTFSGTHFVAPRTYQVQVSWAF